MDSETNINSKQKTESKVNCNDSNETNVISKKKTLFNFDSKTHSSFAKMKEDQVEEKIEKWLDSFEDDESDVKESKNEDKIEEQETTKENYVNENGECNNVISTPNKKKQTYEKAFGENKYFSPKKQILNSDIVDKSLKEQENSAERCTSTQLNAKPEVNFAKNKSDKIKANGEMSKAGKGTQKSMLDFFKKRNI